MGELVALAPPGTEAAVEGRITLEIDDYLAGTDATLTEAGIKVKKS
jgi:hypothetical protein